MNQIIEFIKSVFNSYSALFFSQNRVLGAILLLVSFFNPTSGLAGLGCVIFSLLVCRLLKFNGVDAQTGIYSFNCLLLGIAFGAFYSVNAMFLFWLFIACSLVIIVTIIMCTALGKLGLPMLSLPFILIFWLVLMASNSIFVMGLLQKNSYLLEEIYTGQGNHMAGLEGYLAIQLPTFVSLFFRSLSAVLFQHNIIAGMLIGLGMLIHSRIAFSLLIIGFATAIGLNYVTYTYPEGISYYHLGANFMMAAVAMGSFFAIPSPRSYLLAIFSVPIGFLVINGLTGLMSVHALPVFSLPFCVVNISLLYLLKLRNAEGKLQLVAFQHFSPEKNLYQFLNHKERLNDYKYYKISLPFMGYWTVSQGYNGNITHKGDWAQALDFVISDDDQNTFQYPGTMPEHFYCFNKPVLACAAGVVESVVKHIEDNPIGTENLKENWGNTVVIRHAADFYSKVSHLKKNSVKVKPGDVVKNGDLLGLCGNSGRSPEPHLHFQLQATPYIGSRTLSYPIANYFSRSENKISMKSYAIPTEGEQIGNPEIDASLKKAFDFQPGYKANLERENGLAEDWEVFKDSLDQCYIYCKTTGAAAYFINNGIAFYFTSFYGDKKSLLYGFYLAAYKVIFSSSEGMPVTDKLPLNITGSKPLLWLQDIIAPFYRFIDIKYNNYSLANKNGISIASEIHTQIAGKKTGAINAVVYANNGNLVSFDIKLNGKNITATWGTKN